MRVDLLGQEADLDSTQRLRSHAYLAHPLAFCVLPSEYLLLAPSDLTSSLITRNPEPNRAIGVNRASNAIKSSICKPTTAAPWPHQIQLRNQIIATSYQMYSRRNLPASLSTTQRPERRSTPFAGSYRFEAAQTQSLLSPRRKRTIHE